MKSEKTKPGNVDEYIAGFPKNVQKILKQFRMIVKKAAPKAEEVISYGMPLYILNGRLVYFAAHTCHTGFYPMRTGIDAFKKKLTAYKWAAGSVRFPFDQPLPVRLISDIVKFRVKQNSDKAKTKKKKSSRPKATKT